jgi:hypothetical protein
MDPAQPWVPLEQLDIDPRVVYMASVALCERAYGKPRDDPAGPIDQPSDIPPEERRRRALEEIGEAFRERPRADVAC